MAIEVDGVAPYAPAQAVLATLEFDRKRGLPIPVTPEVVERVGISASLAPRTVQALRLLDLIDADGQPTETMKGLRKASAEDYPERLAEVLRAAYAEVFRYVDPREDGADRIRDAFRHFTPIGMQERMVNLFLGLSAAARIIEEAPKRRGRPPKIGDSPAKQKATVRNRTRADRQAATRAHEAESRHDLLPSPKMDDLHPFIRGLLDTLPPLGAVWSDEEREAWTGAALAAFNLIYKRPAGKGAA